MNILFVCRGNTCRSPLAEAIARKLNDDPQLVFSSAGIAPSIVGGPASAGSRTAAREAGLDLSRHATRAATGALLAHAAMIVALDRSVLTELQRQTAEPLHARMSLLLSHAGPSADVADPFGGNAADYQRAYREIERGVRGMLLRLKQNLPI